MKASIMSMFTFIVSIMKLTNAETTYDTYASCMFHEDCNDGFCCGILTLDPDVPLYIDGEAVNSGSAVKAA